LLFLKNEQVITEVREIRTVPRLIFSLTFSNQVEMKKNCHGLKVGITRRWETEADGTSTVSFQEVTTCCNRRWLFKEHIEEDSADKSDMATVEQLSLLLPASWIPMKNIRVLEVVGAKLKILWRTESQVRAKAGFEFILFLF